MTLPSSRRAPATWLAVVAVAVAATAAGTVAPYPPDLQEDVAGARLLPPLTRAHAVASSQGRVRVVTSLTRGDGQWSARRAGSPVQLELEEGLGAEPRFYLLGTDGLGRDLLSRLLFALRHTLMIALAALGLSLAIGVAVGAASGIAGPFWDALMMRAVDVVLAVPRVLLFLFLAAFLVPSVPMLILALGCSCWPEIARLVRGEMVAHRASGHVEAARASGASPGRLLLRHLLPQAGPVLAVTAALRFADLVLLEAALSFLGLGVPPPAVSLGSILGGARSVSAEAWWIAFWPGVTLVGLVLIARWLLAGLLARGTPPSVI